MSIFGGALVFLYFGSGWFLLDTSGYLSLLWIFFTGVCSLDTFALDSPLEAAEPQGMAQSDWHLEWSCKYIGVCRLGTGPGVIHRIGLSGA